MNPRMLPVLHLRRQAAVHGWKRAPRRPWDVRRLCRYERHDEDGRHFGWVDPGYVPGPGEDFSRHQSPSLCVAQSSDGSLRADHIGEDQAVRLVRAMFGWSEPDADERMVLWPPKSTALVPVAVYTGGAS